MCKKVLVIATLAVLAAVTVVGGPKLVSHLRYWKQQLRTSWEESIPPEQEIARLRMEVDRLQKEDSRAYDKVVHQGREVKKLQKRIEVLKKDLADEVANIREMKVKLTTKDHLITHKGDQLSRDEFQTELRQVAASFMVREEKLKSLQEQLKARKANYEMSKKALFERELAREKLKTELDRLETKLATEKQAQARAKNTLDDASYLRIEDEISAVRERIEIISDKRELMDEVQAHRATRAAKQRSERDAKIDKFLDDPRFSSAEGQ
jgi:predicted  nucleic acid-binding Zn-ribbon protein